MTERNFPVRKVEPAQKLTRNNEVDLSPKDENTQELNMRPEHKRKPPLQQKQKILALGSLQLNEDKSGPRYTHYGDPELIKIVYSDKLRGLSAEQIPGKIEQLQNPAMQAVFRLSRRLKKIEESPDIYDPLARDFLAHLKSLNPLYKNLNIHQLTSLLRRSSQDEYQNFLDSPDTYLPRTSKRVKERQLGSRQKELVLGLLERDEDGNTIYDYYGDIKLLKNVWFSKFVKYEGQNMPYKLIQVHRTMSYESINNFIKRLKSGDRNVVGLINEIINSIPFYKDKTPEDIIDILTRKRSTPPRRSALPKRKKRDKLTTDNDLNSKKVLGKKTTEKSSKSIKSKTKKSLTPKKKESLNSNQNNKTENKKKIKKRPSIKSKELHQRQLNSKKPSQEKQNTKMPSKSEEKTIIDFSSAANKISGKKNRNKSNAPQRSGEVFSPFFSKTIEEHRRKYSKNHLDDVDSPFVAHLLESSNN